MAETALNMIATAHVAYMFTDVFSPYDEPEWTERLKQLRPRIERVLRTCPDLLEDYLVDEDKDNAPPLGSYFSDGWEVYREYDISSPGKEASRGLLQYGFIFDLLFQSQRDKFRAEGSEDANTYLGFLARFGQRWDGQVSAGIAILQAPQFASFLTPRGPSSPLNGARSWTCALHSWRRPRKRRVTGLTTHIPTVTLTFR